MSDPILRFLTDPFLELSLSDEAATVGLAEDLAAILAPGDLIALSGDLGAGKSTFARALLRNMAGDPDLEVPSPTFTLVQTYELGRLTVSHFDLYRLEEPEELAELGLEELLEDGAAVIEWPERSEDLLPEGALWLQLETVGDEGHRNCRIESTNPDWRTRFTRTQTTRRLIDAAGFENGRRRHLTGDASTRSYERIASGTKSAVVMNWPKPEGAAGSDAALTYDKLVHLASDCRAFVAIGNELRRHGYSAPEVLASDLDAGLLVLEDLGPGTVLLDGKPDPDKYCTATLLLAQMHSEDWPNEVPLPEGQIYKIQAYSRQAWHTEASLFLEWYVPYSSGTDATPEAAQEFRRLWDQAFDAIEGCGTGLVLRDYHSPNLIWLADREGTDKIGLIDYQDAVIGPHAYDVASLLLDARVDVSEALENELFETYVKQRAITDPDFDKVLFSAAYAVMGAQRITKVMGIFVRLAKRDGKPGYLTHLPRMKAYLDRVLQHPVLSELKLWYEKACS